MMTRAWLSKRLGVAFRGLFIVFICVFSIAPLIVVFSVAFTTASYFGFPPQGFGLGWMRAAVENEAFVASLWNSVKVSSLVTVFACVLGYMGARSALDQRGRLGVFLGLVLESPLMIPGIIIGFSGSLFYPSIGVGSSYFSTVLGLTVFTLPFAMRSLGSNMASLSSSYPEAAATMGAGPIRILLSVTLPQLLPGIVSAAVFAFVLAFDNVTISLWMTGPGFNLVPLWLLSYMETSSSPLPAAAGTIAATVNLVGFFALIKLGGIEAIVGDSKA